MGENDQIILKTTPTPNKNGSYALLRSFALFCELAFALISVFLRPTAFSMTAFGKCRSSDSWTREEFGPQRLGGCV